VRGALHAEWTKLRTAPGTGLLLLGTAALTVALSTAAVSVAGCRVGGCGIDTTKLSLTGVQLGQAAVAVLAVLAVGGEYGTGMIRTTLAALPRRTAVLAAKAVTVTAVVLVAAAAGVLGSVLAGRLILPGHGLAAPSLADGPTLRAAAGSVLYLGLIALLSLGVAAAVRDSATAIGTVLGLLYLSPLVLQVVTDPAWRRHLRQLAPSTAGLTIQSTTGLHGLPIGPWAGLGVLAAWSAAALLLGALLLEARDA
jgi:ABC-2 type transport system permease protein